MLFCGVDCGYTGIICFIDKNVKIQYIYDMPIYKNKKQLEYDIQGLINIFKKHINSQVLIEKQWARPNQDVSSGSKIAYGYGLLMGICNSINRKVISETPSFWQKNIASEFHDDTGILEFKNKNIDYQIISDNIKNSKIKDRFNKIINLKSTKISKIQSLYYFYLLTTRYLDILNHVDIKNHNIIDAFLISYVCSKFH